MVRFFIYNCLCACLGRLVLTTRALVRGLFRHCRVYGNILPPAGTDISVSVSRLCASQNPPSVVLTATALESSVFRFCRSARPRALSSDDDSDAPLFPLLFSNPPSAGKPGFPCLPRRRRQGKPPFPGRLLLQKPPVAETGPPRLLRAVVQTYRIFIGIKVIRFL